MYAAKYVIKSVKLYSKPPITGESLPAGNPLISVWKACTAGRD